jgi:hypothetical protein
VDQIRKRLAEQRKIVKDVLEGYLEIFDCPCDWPQFIYWVGKEQGPGWQDGIQNDLVEIALELPFYRSDEPSQPEYWLASEVTCERCGARWKCYSVEWRMLAFQNRLVRLDKGDLGLSEFPDLIISNSISATVGHEPGPKIPRLTTEEWVRFMKG